MKNEKAKMEPFFKKKFFTSIGYNLYMFLALAFSLTLLIASCEKETNVNVFSSVDELIETALDDSLFTGAVLLIGTSEKILHHRAFGYADLYDYHLNRSDQPVQMTKNHLFDLASLTKILAATYGMMTLHDQNLVDVDVDDPVHVWLPEFNTPDKRTITIKQLLNHTSGLMQWYPGYYVASSPEERLQFLVSRPLDGSPGENRRYSDYGFMVLGDVIERAAGLPLDQFLAEKIYGPMGLTSTVFNPDVSRFPNIAATSHGNPFEKRMVYEDDFGYTVDVDPETWNGWREYTFRGEANDGNAFHTHRGVAGHAGLFSTAEEVYTLLKVMLNGGKHENLELFSPETIGLFLTEDPFGHGLGWMMSAASLHAGELPEGSFGHTGFTGTNIVVSPKNNLILVFLTNRQHVGVDENGLYPNLREIREAIIGRLLDLR